MIARHYRSLPVLFLAAVTLSCGRDGTAPENPTPGITSLSPTIVEQGSSEFTLTVTGSDFVRASTLFFNGSERATEFVSQTELRATILAADLSLKGLMHIVVVNPAPGGGTSNVATLLVSEHLEPSPGIISITPPFVTAGDSGVVLTITGANFLPESWVVISEVALDATYLSPTQLRVSVPDSLVAEVQTHIVFVVNPQPGGSSLLGVLVEVHSPVPHITSLSEMQTSAGQAELTIQVTGRGFVSASQVRFNGAPRATKLIAPGLLEATLIEGDLRAAGTFSITVGNPAPGGGPSNALSFTVVNGTPEITLLPSGGATAGRPGFTLYVHGTGFVNGSVVRWNGVDRPTQYLSGTRLAATISASDVAQPGIADVTIFNPPPDGGTSMPATMTIRSLGASSSSTQEVTLPAGDLAFDQGTGLLYVSVPGSVQTYGNSIVAVDPNTGAITNSVFVGSEPRIIARSDNGQYLYVGLNGASAVRRVALPSLTAGLQWSLLNGEVAGDMVVLPGSPNSVAVTRQNLGTSPPLHGVTVYDDGIARPVSSPGHTGGNRLEGLGSDSVLYGYNNSHTGFEFFTIGVDASGARHLIETGGLISGFYTDIVGASGRIYATDGSIVDAERRTRVGSFPTAATMMAVDASLGRAYLLGGSQIGVYDINTFQLLGSVAIPTPNFAHPANLTPKLIRWGSDGLAFLDETRIFIVRSPLFAP